MIETGVTICALVGAWQLGSWGVRVVGLMFFDRDGNSGRSPSGHWWVGKEHD